MCPSSSSSSSPSCSQTLLSDNNPYECEFGCGFDGPTVEIVEEHEKTCAFRHEQTTRKHERIQKSKEGKGSVVDIGSGFLIEEHETEPIGSPSTDEVTRQGKHDCKFYEEDIYRWKKYPEPRIYTVGACPVKYRRFVNLGRCSLLFTSAHLTS